MNGNGHIRAVGYVRCSTEMQEDSPDQQKKEILGYAARNGYRIEEWFVDIGKSGTTFDERPEFLRMVHEIDREPSFHAVICYDESRWGRAIDSAENTYWRVYFRKRGVNVLLAKSSIDPHHEYAPMLESFESIQSSQFSKKLSELTLRGALNNGRYSSGGTSPYGYARAARNLVTGEVRLLEPGSWCIKKQEKVFWVPGNEREVSTVRFIFEERAKGLSHVLIAKALNDRNIPCARRGKWRNLDRKWSNGTIKSIIENPVYCGRRVYNRFSSSKILAAKRGKATKRGVRCPVWKNPTSEWVISDEAHEGIVTKELWEKANAVNRKKPFSHKNLHTYRSQYLLTGLIRCSDCGFAFQGWSGKVRGKKYLRYIDGGWQSKRVCSFLSIPKGTLEDFAIKAVKETLNNPEMIRRIEHSLEMLLRRKANEAEFEGPRLRESIADLQKKIANLLALVEDGQVRGDSVRERIGELEAEKGRLEHLLSKEGPPSGQLVVSQVGRQVREFIQSFEERFEKAPIEERKWLVQKCISHILVDRKNSVARFYVRKVPLASPILEEMESAKSVMSRASARNRT